MTGYSILLYLYYLNISALWEILRVYSNCLTYFIHLDEDGLPISDTMFSKNGRAKIDKGYGCREAILPPVQMLIPTGHVACYHKSHFRYFYKVNSQTGKILPSSFWHQIGKPRSMCSGIYKILEYKPFI